MIAQFTGAASRALLVALLVAMPSLLLAEADPETAQIATLIALIFAGFVFVEYYSAFPSLLEFRFAPPVNRMRFLAIAMVVFALTAIARNDIAPSALSHLLSSLAAMLGSWADISYSPVHLVVLMMPDSTDYADIEKIRNAAALSYLFSLLTLAVFVLIMKLRNWPFGNGAFNVWMNLPLFDPTAGGDVIERLTQQARINLALGFVLPFLAPSVVKKAIPFIDPTAFCDPQTLIWTATLWAFIPASLSMRGIAMLRVADLISKKRRRMHEAEALQAT